MPKQRRTRARQEAKASSGAKRAPESRNEQLLGNSVLAQRAPDVTTTVDEEQSAVDEARTLIERGFFALYAEPRAQVQVDKWVRVLEGSKLPTDRRVALVDKLTVDQEAAVAAAEAVERWFGGGEQDASARGLEALDQVWSGLRTDREADDRSPEALIEGLAGEAAESVVGFCREVYLILGFQQEEEEEEEDLGAEVAPELG